MNDIAQWTAPSPLWAAAVNDIGDPARSVFRQPAILRFASDSFMDDFMALMANDPTRLAEYLAQPETWREPQKTPASHARLTGFDLRLERLRLAAERRALGTALPVPAGAQALAQATQKRAESQLKLYQPANQRFYLITACCVCRVAGLPDKAFDAGRAERATFVLRRLVESEAGSKKQYDEYGFVVTQQGNVWKKVPPDGKGEPVGLVKGEEQLPLFSLSFAEGDGRSRRLLGGLIPVGKRGAYMGAPLSKGSGNGASNGNGTTNKTARKILFRDQVTESWKTLITLAEDTRKKVEGGPVSPADQKPVEPMSDPKMAMASQKSAREQIQTVSWLVLLDFSDYLRQYLPDVWISIKTGTNVTSLTQAQINLLEALEKTTTPPSLIRVLIDGQLAEQSHLPCSQKKKIYVDSAVASSLRDALRKMILFDGEKPRDQRNLELVKKPYNRSDPDPHWPPFLFPLADPETAAPQIPAVQGVTLDRDEDEIVERPPLANRDNIDKLAAYVVRALPEESSAPEPPPPLAARRPFVQREGLFHIRCIYERPDCGPLEPTLVSDPSTPFQMAGFFDPDAPARPIRIELPMDTSPAGLRKYDKNTAFMISDVLCGQIGRFKKLSLGDLVLSVLPWPFYKPLDMSAPDQGACEGGEICSLSIPIITICALILLMVIAFLFTIIFMWIPWFIRCFPLPGFKAKAS
jgi:hypothetical protein